MLAERSNPTVIMDGGGSGFGTGDLTDEELEAWEREIASYDDQTPDYSSPYYD